MCGREVHILNNKLRSLSKLETRICLAVIALFCAVTALTGNYAIAAGEAVVFVVVLVYTIINEKKKMQALDEHITSIRYDADSAKENTVKNFPLPISAFKMSDTTIIWGNDKFFKLCGEDAGRLDAKVSDFIPDFTSKWLETSETECPDTIEIGGKKYRLFGNIVQSANADGDSFMGICYWFDVSDFENLKKEFDDTKPVVGVVVIDNLDELIKNQPDRVKNDIRDAVEDKLDRWRLQYGGFVRRYDRDRYIAMFDKLSIERMKERKFPIVQEMHQVENPGGVDASISIGLGIDGANFSETIQFADIATELALTRGGDQVVIKDRTGFEFFGGRGYEVEKRTKVRSRVMANTLAELVRDSSKVIVMGHRYSDLDSIGAAVGICALAKKCGKRYSIIVNCKKTAAKELIDRMRMEHDYKEAFIDCSETSLKIDARTLLVIVDTNRPEQVEDEELLKMCRRVAVIDHHRVAATYIQNAALGFVEPYASSACELVTEILQEVLDGPELLRYEAEAILSGIVLDTKKFTIRTGERTFDAASYLRHAGADTADVVKLLQTDMPSTIAKYKIMQEATLYNNNIAIAAPREKQNRIIAAQAADGLLNISGVDASIVVFPDEDGEIFASARSIGNLNVQILMEKLGGGGNRSAAAVQFKGIDIDEAVRRIYDAIDEYMS
jgi:cyclic-di-AMP phosphodiesterase